MTYFTNKHNSLIKLLSIKAVKKNNKRILEIFVIGEIHTNKKYSHTNNFSHIYKNNNMLFRQQTIDSWWDGKYNIRNKYGKYKYGKYKKTIVNNVKYCQILSNIESLSKSLNVNSLTVN